MKVIVVGGTGTIGRAVVRELSTRHEVIAAGHKTGDINVDITNPGSVEQMFQSVGRFDAVVSTTGKVEFKELLKMSPEDYMTGLKDKLMGQVNLVVIGQKYINEKGSFTLTSGILSHDPIVAGSSAAMVNGAINGFVVSAAIELLHGIRINAVSPNIVAESMGTFGEHFHGFEAVPVAKVATAYSKSVQGHQTGQVYKVGYS